MTTRFDDKAGARQYAWDQLVARGLACPPLPAHGRIPAFAGARRAAERLLAEPPWSTARTLKINPDRAAYWVRRSALERGIRVLVATPALAGSFVLIDPANLPRECLPHAATWQGASHFGRAIVLAGLPPVDAIVAGSVAVTRAGKRCGKGAGYSDIEYAILLELGHAPVPVATAVHDVQIVDDFPVFATDVPLGLICTPREAIRVPGSCRAPKGIDWQALDAAALEAMPVLRELRCAS